MAKRKTEEVTVHLSQAFDAFYRQRFASTKDEGVAAKPLVIDQDFQKAMRRDPDQQMLWLVLSDGQEDLLHQSFAAVKR